MLVLGVLFGIGLVLAARAFVRQENPLVEDILKLLPGLNCGACRYKGCRDYAEAVAAGAKVNQCAPGGAETVRSLAALLGVEAPQTAHMRAVVHCQGGRGRCGSRFLYVGEQDCLAALMAAGGPKACLYGCLGLGSCARACPFGAITMSDEGLPVVDPDKCTACGICVQTCPRDLMSVLPVQYATYLGCSSQDRGKEVRDVCSVGCIACGLCAKNDPHGAIVMKGNLPVLDFEKAGGDFSAAAQVCPMSCFGVEGAQPAVAEAAASGAAGSQA
jgi:Na+-translocating ferredoxin:NAD+ oxidoreductase RNF subunit RnfB